MAISFGFLILTTIHLVCFALSMAICVFYGANLLHRRNELDQHVDSNKCIYAIVVGALSAVTCVLYFVPRILRVASAFAVNWDIILCILWINLSTFFGETCKDEDFESAIHMCKNENLGGNAATQRGECFDMAGTFLWMFATFDALVHWWLYSDVQPRSGRARV